MVNVGELLGLKNPDGSARAMMVPTWTSGHEKVASCAPPAKPNRRPKKSKAAMSYAEVAAGSTDNAGLSFGSGLIPPPPPPPSHTGLPDPAMAGEKRLRTN